MIKKSYWISFIMWFIVDLLDMSQGKIVNNKKIPKMKKDLTGIKF